MESISKDHDGETLLELKFPIFNIILLAFREYSLQQYLDNPNHLSKIFK
jgi:hypothetical protein